MSASAPSLPPVAPSAPAKPLSPAPSASGSPRRGANRAQKLALGVFQSLIVIVVFTAFWQLLVSKGWVERTVLPAPVDVAKTFYASATPRLPYAEWKTSEAPIIEREEKEYQTSHRRADELAAKEAAGQSPRRSLWRRTMDGIGLAWESIWRPLGRLYRGTWLNWLLSGELINDAVGSLGRVVTGFLIGAIPALILGLGMGASNLVYRLMNPIVQVLRPIPPIAWIPLAILWFGLGNQPARFLIAIGAFFPVLINTIAGVRNVDGIYIRAARNLGVGRMQMFWRVIIPAAMPYILTGVKVGIGVAFIVVIVAEMIAPPDGGLGYRINEAREFFKSDVVVCGMISIGILGLLIDVLISKLNNHLLRWHRGAEQN